MLRRTAYVLLAALALAACNTTDTLGPGPNPITPPPVNFTQAIPLIDLVRDDGVANTYYGFEGGLYLGSNDAPDAHAAFGADAARQIQPLNGQGNPDPNGAIGLMSISMSNATQEWCHGASTGAPNDTPCHSWTFMGKAANDPSLNDDLVIVNGARGGQALDRWDNPDDAEYRRIEEQVLPAYGLTESQIQIVWVKAALPNEPSRDSLGSPTPNDADAYALEATIGNVVRALQQRYPKLQQVFFTSRIYGGYANPNTNSPEPWAYETGFGTKWAIEAQITQRATGQVDAQTGNLSGTPFMAWGPYLWAVWPESYFEGDGIHPNRDGEERVADALIAFFKTSALTRCWFVEGLTCS
ncbi:MAG: hypothetical protein HKN04_09905 [Rhodothermaceae bacterium]|nr:hypothetical protein [Rhodothermaceae bacterium]